MTPEAETQLGLPDARAAHPRPLRPPPSKPAVAASPLRYAVKTTKLKVRLSGWLARPARRCLARRRSRLTLSNAILLPSLLPSTRQLAYPHARPLLPLLLLLLAPGRRPHRARIACLPTLRLVLHCRSGRVPPLPSLRFSTRRRWDPLASTPRLASPATSAESGTRVPTPGEATSFTELLRLALHHRTPDGPTTRRGVAAGEGQGLTGTGLRGELAWLLRRSSCRSG